MRPLIQVMEYLDAPTSSTHLSTEQPWESVIDVQDNTDRQLRFPKWRESFDSRMTTQSIFNPVSDLWLKENDVHTEFLDAGIGCCWFAYQGDQEAVVGETQDEAILRLAACNGLQLWRGP